MKYLVLILMLSSSRAYCLDKLEVVKETIKYMQPSLSANELSLIASSLLKQADSYNMDWKVMASIIAQESSFRQDPQNCLHIKRMCDDLGIAQINFSTWSESLGLDRNRLLRDIDYNIETMAKILSILMKKYNKEQHWVTRYHSFSRKHRQLYYDFIFHKYLEIDGYSKGYTSRASKNRRS